jgi:hypothetical protein
MLLSTDRIDTKNRRITSEIYRKIHISTQEGYRLAFLLKDSDGETGPLGEFRNLQRLGDSSSRRNNRRLMLLILDPAGESVRDAGVVFTLICPHNVHKMDIGTLVQTGYHFEFEAAHDGFYRVETEIVAKGQLLATDFAFEIFQGIGRSS